MRQLETLESIYVSFVCKLVNHQGTVSDRLFSSHGLSDHGLIRFDEVMMTDMYWIYLIHIIVSLLAGFGEPMS